jgi:hypothetical protein
MNLICNYILNLMAAIKKKILKGIELTQYEFKQPPINLFIFFNFFFNFLFL